jgi:hypothetical protein
VGDGATAQNDILYAWQATVQPLADVFCGVAMARRPTGILRPGSGVTVQQEIFVSLLSF